MDEACIPFVEDLDKRKIKHQAADLVEKDIPHDCKIYRAIRRLDRCNPQMPDYSCFTEKGLSVLIVGQDLPVCDAKQVFEVWRQRGYLGLWEVPREAFPEPEFKLRHDPFPFDDVNGAEQTQDPNHAQIFCRKTQSKGKEIAKNGRWIVEPTVISS